MTVRTDEQYQRLENREQVRLKVRQIGRRVSDMAELAMERRFDDALLDGNVLRLGFTDEELRELVHTQATKLLHE
jgi:hypothetical protein